MVNYYNTLKVSPKASSAEIKSAYRRLARKLHPDVNNGSEETARRFAEIAEAYEILGSSRERAAYDKKLLHASLGSSSNGNSFFESNNPHARRWRQMVIEKRYNEIIDRLIEEERRETTAFQRVVYPVVALFVSTFFVAIIRPKIFTETTMIGKVIIISLFIVGVIHLFDRLRDGFERYTFDEKMLHESIFDGNEQSSRPYSRTTAAAFLIGGVLAAFGAGFVLGLNVEFIADTMPDWFSRRTSWEFVFYPPIIVFFVDVMHTLVSRNE
jgi:hypothetical protein